MDNRNDLNNKLSIEEQIVFIGGIRDNKFKKTVKKL